MSAKHIVEMLDGFNKPIEMFITAMCFSIKDYHNKCFSSKDANEQANLKYLFTAIAAMPEEVNGKLSKSYQLPCIRTTHLTTSCPGIVGSSEEVTRMADPLLDKMAKQAKMASKDDFKEIVDDLLQDLKHRIKAQNVAPPVVGAHMMVEASTSHKNWMLVR